ncbi:nucleotide disphospho-sugar-binding domain-containing protein [Nostoc sp. NIES-2111]
MSRILFVSPPYAGHANPQRVLLQAAEAAGYTCDHYLGGPYIDDLFRVANTSHRVGSHPWRVLAQLDASTSLLKPLQDHLRQHIAAFQPDLIVADSVAVVTAPLAHEFQLPWITTIATPFAIEQSTGTPAYCGGWHPGHPLRDRLGRAAIRYFKDFAFRKFRHRFSAIGYSQRLRPDGTEVIYSPHCILGYGMTELEFPRDWPPHFEMIGPVILRGQPEPRLRSVSGLHVLVTLGTHLPWAKDKLIAEVEVLARRLDHIEFTVSLGGSPGYVERRSHNINVLRYVDYHQHLPNFDIVLHHGGAGIAYATILAGRPHVVVPQDYDHFDYAARLVHHGLALAAPSIRQAHHAILAAADLPLEHCEPFQRIAQSYQPTARFLHHVERFIGKAVAATA